MGAQQATTAVGTEDPESTVAPAKNRRRRGATHYTHKKKKTAATGSVRIVLIIDLSFTHVKTC